MEETRLQVHQVRLLKGITKPNEEFENMREADKIEGLGWRLVVLSIVSAIFAGLSVYFIQALGLADEMNKRFEISGSQMSESNVELGQTFALASGVFGGLVGPVITMVIGALIFLIFFSDIGFKKLFAIELYLQVIGLINTIVALILILIFQTYSGTFLNLGAITQLLTDDIFINSFFGGISIFLIWKLYVQINAYAKISTKSPAFIVWTPIILNLVWLLVLAGFGVLGHQMMEQLEQMPQMNQKS
ncbi:MAG TPA: YIP1 family protein [Bacillales bacterium]|nr:YIP1 family protein [Bacillales bacterium]